jgi:hypothetical protein
MDTISAGRLWTGRFLSGIAGAFLLMDAAGKLMKVAPAMEGTRQLGYPESLVFTLGVLLHVGLVLYAIPRTCVLGAIYLAAFLGGAVATHVRVGNPLATHILFPVYLGMFLWTGLALRKPKLLSLLTRGDQ